MNWEAFAVIGLFTLVLGTILYLPARFWVRRKVRSDPIKYAGLGLTRLGWVFVVIEIVVLFGGYSTQYIAPESVLGEFVKTSRGQFLYMVMLVTVFWLLEMVLKWRGIYLIRDSRKRG